MEHKFKALSNIFITKHINFGICIRLQIMNKVMFYFDARKPSILTGRNFLLHQVFY